MFRRLAVSVFIVLVAATSAAAQGYGVGTPVEAKKMVEKAVEFIKANGEEMALQEFNNPNGKFQWRDLYVFAYDLNGVVVGHPNPRLIGQNLYEEPDAQGNSSRKKSWISPTAGDRDGLITGIRILTQQEELKITHFQKVGNLIVCCGAYLP